jgi:hypothetical protein
LKRPYALAGGESVADGAGVVVEGAAPSFGKRRSLPPTPECRGDSDSGGETSTSGSTADADADADAPALTVEEDEGIGTPLASTPGLTREHSVGSVVSEALSLGGDEHGSLSALMVSVPYGVHAFGDSRAFGARDPPGPTPVTREPESPYSPARDAALAHTRRVRQLGLEGSMVRL